jgi:DNA-binding NtrC family response regulator
MSAPTKILLIEDDPGIVETMRRVLTGEGYEVVVRQRGDDGLAAATAGAFNVVVTDLRLPGLSGLELIRRLHAANPRLPIILVTAFGTTDTAIEAMKYGAYDYLLKPFDLPQMLALVRKAAESNRFMAEPVVFGSVGNGLSALVGRSAAMQAIYKEVGRVASKPVNVLIRGETGTGKELIARALYQYGDRSAAPFIAINCAAIPETLLESELFGHERGAFTGAGVRRIGRFEQADHGTLFLDEVGDMTPATQAKLVRVLQEKCLQRLGGGETIAVDVRVMAATHRDLEAAIRDKQFREDFYYRLSMVEITLPPLRSRREDIPDLVGHFLWRHGRDLGTPEAAINADALALLQEQPWPGNVRELENVVRKLLLSSRGFRINLEHVRDALAKADHPDFGATGAFREYVDNLLAAARRGETADTHAQALTAVERELFSRAIGLAQGNQTKAARWLGVSRITMKAKLLQFGFHPRQDGEG